MTKAINKLCRCYIKGRREKHFLVYRILFSKRMLLVERASGASSGRGALPNAKNLILKVEVSCYRV